MAEEKIVAAEEAVEEKKAPAKKAAAKPAAEKKPAAKKAPAKKAAPGVGAEPAAAPVGEVIDRRKQPRLPAELLCVLFRIAILVQQGNTASVQPEQPLLLIPGDADVLDRVRREASLVP